MIEVMYGRSTAAPHVRKISNATEPRLFFSSLFLSCPSLFPYCFVSNGCLLFS